MNVTTGNALLARGITSTSRPSITTPQTAPPAQLVGETDLSQVIADVVEGTDVSALLSGLMQNFALVSNTPCCCPPELSESNPTPPVAGQPSPPSGPPSQPSRPIASLPPQRTPGARPGQDTPGRAESAGPNLVPPPAPLPATTNLQETQAWIPLDAPRTNAPGQRSADEYGAVIDQFDVENNPRYTPRVQNPGGPLDTFCNIFVSDVTKAMGADIPHYWQGQELDANRTADWLRDSGPDFGWREVNEREAQDLANEGKPVVVTWKNPNGIGHSGVIRPGEINENGPALAQAGSETLNNTHVRETFGDVPVVYYANN